MRSCTIKVIPCAFAQHKLNNAPVNVLHVFNATPVQPNSRPSFTPWAVRRIHRYATGIPRLINAVCDKTLLCGFVYATDTLNLRHVGRAIRELEGRLS